jgi:hypothetical protein
MKTKTTIKIEAENIFYPILYYELGSNDTNVSNLII